MKSVPAPASPEPQPSPEHARKRVLLLAWAIGATVTTLVATITSAAENEFVFGLVNAPEFFTVEHGAGPALGGFQQDGSEEPAGGWCWLTGEPWSYSNWMHGEPNNGRAREGTEDRVMYYSGIPRTPAATWNDIQRSDRNNLMLAYVVERNH